MSTPQKYVYISGLDEIHGPMDERKAWSLANDQNRLSLEMNENHKFKYGPVHTIAIVLDHLDYKPTLWGFTAEHPSEQKP